MAQAPVAPPRVYQTTRPNAMQITSASDSTNTFVAQQFVKYNGVAGALTTCVAGETTAVVGLTLDASHASTDEPYTAPFGENHNCQTLQETSFVVNTGINATPALGTGTSSGLIKGSGYGVSQFTTAGYSGVFFLDTANTTAQFFRFTDFYPGDSTADTNARVIVHVINTASSV